MISLTRLIKPKQKINLLVALVFLSLQLPLSLLAMSPVSADHRESHRGTGSTGNNGTLKVHEFGTTPGTESNDPKVCAFRFEGFDFDALQSGYIVIEPQGNDSTTTDTAQLDFGPTNSDGYAATAYLNNGPGTEQLDNGHYKATLYGKDTGGNINLEDDKAKSKNFKVICGNDSEVGSLIVNKNIIDAEGNVVGSNVEANELGFRWSYNDSGINNMMGTQIDDLDPNTYTITENNESMNNYEFKGYYTDEGNCEEVEEDTVLPISVSVESNSVTSITLCNQLVEEEALLGSITITKDAQPNNLQDFLFTAMGLQGVTSFTLDDDGDNLNTHKNSVTYDNLPAKEYSFTETPTEGWTLASITCNTNEGVTIAMPKVTIDLAEGADVSCTFVNTLNQTTGQVLGDSVTITQQVTTAAVGGSGGTVLGAQTVAPVGGVSAGFGGASQAGASLGSLAGLASSLSALGYGVAASLRKR